MGEPVFLVGTAAEVGAIQGQLQRDVLQERVARTLQRAEIAGTTGELRSRAGQLAQVVETAAPHWLEESSALCSAAGIELWHLLALNALPANFWGQDYVPAPIVNAQTGEVVSAFEAQGYEPLMGGDCTTFFALAEATLGGETLFHKNREERDEVQWLGIKQVLRSELRVLSSTAASSTQNSNFNTQNFNRYVGGADIGHLGIAHLHAEDYWVGANNTGSPILESEYRDCALNDGHVLRFLAERCTGLDDIVPALDDLIARKLLGGAGVGYGMIFVFADASRGLVVECTSRRVAFRWYEGDAMEVRTNHFVLQEMQDYALAPSPNSIARHERAVELWHKQEGFASISACGEIGRDREDAPHAAIARNPSDQLGSVTVSASTATISQSDDRRCQTHFRNCHPSYTPVVILTPLDRVSDSDLVSGSHNQEWRAYRHSLGE